MLFWHSPRLFFPARRSSKFVKAKTMPNLKKVVWAVLNSRDGNSQLARLLTIADLVLQVLSFVAQNERENIRSRQAQGIAAAKQSGVRFGHAPRPLPQNFPETYTLWTEGAISTSEAAKRSGMARSTFRIRAESFKKNCP